MGKRRLIAETGAGQHGVATATAAALFGLECAVYMGEVDTERQALNVFRMRLLGAEVSPVLSGSRTLKDAVNEALRDWVASVETTHYCIGSVMGPHPYPYLVRELQRVVGDEAREQCRALTGGDPDVVVACVGGGSNAAGTFAGFVDTAARLVGVEAAGGAAMGNGVPGVVHGMRSRFLQDEAGQILEAESISAGLDYPGIGPEHAFLGELGRARYESVGDDEVLGAFRLLAETEGIIPALEPAHALAWLVRAAGRPVAEGGVAEGSTVVLTLSGRGDKDVAQVMDLTRSSGVPGRLESTLRNRRSAGRKLLVPYLTGGLGPGWLEMLRAVAASGADAVEIGIPFSDPVMDGPVIQAASAQALAQGATPASVLAGLARAEVGVPLVVMTYYNLIARAGHLRSASELAAAGVSGAILPDLPLDEATDWLEVAAGAGVETVLLAAPTTPDERLERIAAASSGFLYAVGLLGVTGERSELAGSATVLAERCKKVTDLPVLVGVGISTPDQAAAVCEVADGVVVGSALVRRVLEGATPEEAGELVASFRTALDG